MTTPRGPRGNRRPRVAGQPARRPGSPTRPTSKPADTDTSSTPETVDTTPATTTPAGKTPVERKPGKKAPAEKAPAEKPASTPATDTAATAPAEEKSADADEAAPVDLAKAPAKPAGPRGKTRPAVKVSTIKPQSTRPSAKRPATTTTTTEGGSRRRRFLGWRTVGVIAAIAVVIGAIAGVAAARPGVDLSSNEAFVDPALTSQVSAQAKSRICSVFAVNYAKLDDWERTAKANVTGEASTRFTQYAGAVRDALGQTGLTEGGVDCRVDTVGVRDLTDSNATLVVNLILSQTEGQQASGSGTKRYQVAMQNVNGQWLVSNFSDF